MLNKAVDNIKNSDSTVSSMNLLLILSADNPDILSEP